MDRIALATVARFSGSSKNSERSTRSAAGDSAAKGGRDRQGATQSRPRYDVAGADLVRERKKKGALTHWNVAEKVFQEQALLRKRYPYNSYP